MEQVSNINKQRGAVKITYSDGTIMVVPSPLYALRPLRSGDMTDRAEYTQWVRQNEYTHALAAAVRYLAACDRSRQEVCARLAESGYTPETADRAADYLTRCGLLSDARLAEVYAQSRGARFGRRRVEMDLKRKGISSEAAAEAVSAIDENVQSERAARLAGQFANRTNSGDPRTLNRRVIGMLMRRGFTYAQSRLAADSMALSPDGISAEDEESS
jgi:regulatory protein